MNKVRDQDNTINEILEFFFKLSSVFFRNEEPIAEFKERSLRAVTHWYDKSEQSPLFLQKNSDTGAINLLTALVDTGILEGNTLLIIKNQPITDDGHPIESQFNTLLLPREVAFETLKSLVDFGISEVFEQFVFGQTHSKVSNSELLINAKQRIKDLSISLHNLDAEIQIPDIENSIHPTVKKIVSEGAGENNIKDFLSVAEMNDSTFLNSLQKTSNSWIKAIQHIVRMEKNLEDGTSLNEIQFWKNFNSALTELDRRLNSTEVKLTIAILSSAKRFHATNYLTSDNGLNAKINESQAYSVFLSSLSVEKIFSASSLVQLDSALNSFALEFKKLKTTKYPLERAVRFIELLSQDVRKKIMDLLPNTLMSDYNEFISIHHTLTRLFDGLEEKMKDITILIRELMRKRSEKFVFVKLSLATDDLRSSIDGIGSFRSNHNNFMLALEKISLNDHAVKLSTIYDSVKITDPLKVSHASWKQMEMDYNKDILTIEDNITAALRSELSKAISTEEMFSVFEKYIPLMDRPRISGAVREFLHQLLINIKRDLAILRSSASHHGPATDFRIEFDIKSFNNKLFWRRKLKAKLTMVDRSLYTILGNNWRDSMEAKEIRKEFSLLNSMLDFKDSYLVWLDNAQKHVFSTDHYIIKILCDDDFYGMHINFSNNDYSLYKEVRALIWNGYEIPTEVLKKARITRNIYPHAVLLNERLKTFFMILETTRENVISSILLASKINKIWDLLDDLALDTWSTVPFFINPESDTSDRTSTIFKFEDHVQRLFKDYEDLEMIEMEVHEFFKEFEKIEIHNLAESKVETLQNLVDNLSVKGYENIISLVNFLNENLKAVLLEKLTAAMQNFDMFDIEQKIVHSNNAFNLEPSSSSLKEIWAQHLHQILQYGSKQKKIKLCSLEGNDDLDDFFTISQLQVASKSQILHFFQNINRICKDSEKHLSYWQGLMGLWNITEQKIARLINDDLSSCFEIMSQLLEDKKRLTDLPVRLDLKSGVTLDQEKVQVLCLQKYDIFESQIVNELLSLYMNQSNEFHRALVDFRTRLEEANIVNVEIKEVAEVISVLDKINESSEKYSSNYRLMQKCQKLIIQQRYKIPKEFMYIEQLKFDLDALKQSATKVARLLEENRGIITSDLEREVQNATTASTGLIEQWEKCKSVSSNADPTDELRKAILMESSMVDLERHKRKLAKIGKLLLVPVSFNSLLSRTLEEVKFYKNLWESIAEFWTSIQGIVNIPWLNTDSAIVENKLRDLLERSNNLSPVVLQYSLCQDLFQSIRSMLDALKIIGMLQTCGMKYRHWKELFEKLGNQEINTHKLETQTFTLMDVISLNISLNEETFNAVINKARDEQLIEESLSNVKERWRICTLETFEHKSGQHLVKNWEYLFSLSSDDIALLTSTKHSPYYKIFEQEIFEWESKLSQFSDVLLNGLETQKQWIYLYGVLCGDSELKNQLPAESHKFSSLTLEFNMIFGTLIEANSPLDVLHTTEYLAMLKRLLDSLNTVRKSLYDFLESQRSLFPRFYFVGNEDLLQLVGSNNDFSVISSHIRKMFPSIDQIFIKDGLLTSAVSPEGETIHFKKPIDTSSFPKLHELMTVFESELKYTLAHLLEECLNCFSLDSMTKIIVNYPFQITLLALQIYWTSFMEQEKNEYHNMLASLSTVVDKLLLEKWNATEAHMFLKLESLIAEIIHLTECTASLIQHGSRSITWSNMQRFYYLKDVIEPCKRVIVKQNNIEMLYGFEYIGVPESLIHTPLLEKCFSTMVHALSKNLGGSPFGPAGTGKTETIKFLGQRLGRYVLVFNCDDTFDYQSLNRILFGITQVGAWGCFDEFNRLDQNLLSAVSSQIEIIQSSLLKGSRTITILGREGLLDADCGLFITMNLGYAGRAELPGNLKSMFREFALTAPESILIVSAILTGIGFSDSKTISKKLVEFFEQLKSKTTKQIHYDFGLRALKSVLRNVSSKVRSSHEVPDEFHLLQSVCQMVSPKLVDEDELLFRKLLNEMFPKFIDSSGNEPFLLALREYCDQNIVVTSPVYEKKCEQLFEMQKAHQGIILVGEAGCGKTSVLTAVTTTIQKLSEQKIIIYTLPTKALTKIELFGSLDPITYEWKDGLFASILRAVSSDALGKFKNKDIWIVFDSDLDPQYTETLNSVLDDNKILTLPNGERLEISQNIRIIFEVDNLRHATPATVSRCGMIWFNSNITQPYKLLISKIQHYFLMFNHSVQNASVIKNAVDSLLSFFDEAILEMISEKAESYHHVMGFDISTVLSSFSSMFASDIIHNAVFLGTLNQSDFKKYLLNRVVLNILWCFVGGCSIEEKLKFSTYLSSLFIPLGLVKVERSLLDYHIPENSSDLSLICVEVNSLHLEAHEVLSPDIIIPTVDTYRHEDILFRMLLAEKPLILCGPPGSGKTMTLFSALKTSEDFEVVGMNFSKDTTVGSFLKTIEQHTSYHSSPEGSMLEPRAFGKQLVFFCDEINLPKNDNYGTQPVIQFLRQLVERRGFWHTKENKWVSLRRIQFVAACNPPTDAGRTLMTKRFTRHCTTLMVDYPAEDSLVDIYSTLFRTTLKMTPLLKSYGEPLAHASIQIYYACRYHFTVTDHQHYIFSPRELTRCVRGIHYALENSTNQDLEFLLKIWFNELRRILGDRLVAQEEKAWLDSTIKEAALKYFPNPNLVTTAMQSAFFSSWINSSYEEVEEDKLRNFITERIKTFSEEELGNDIIVYREMIQNMLKIDRVLKQVQGHSMLVGPSGSGKTTMVRFVSWLNGIKIRVPNVHRNFSLDKFDSFLREVLIDCGVGGQKTCLLLDESNMMETSFIERMNTLLANSDIPGLFEEEELNSLMSKIRNKVQSLGLLLDSRDEMYDWFKLQISRHLHVTFTINDPHNHASSKLIASPALFNRCVMNWIGQWNPSTLNHVADHVIGRLPLDYEELISHDKVEDLPKSYRKVISSVFVSSFKYYQKLESPATSPSLFLDSLRSFKKQYLRNISDLDSKSRFVKVGIDKLRETLLKVKQLNVEMQEKKNILRLKELEARETLDRMLFDQNKSERKEEASIEIQKILAEQEKNISSRRDVVMEELATVEPAITEAQQGVKNIKKQQLTELRTMLNPPITVKITLEAVCVILGFQCSSWRDIQQTIRKDDFIARIVTFDTESMLQDSLKQYIKDEYLSRPNFNFANVQRASQACGPLFQWVVAQISYSDILLKVGPLKRDLSLLEAEILKTRAKLIAADEMIKELREQIEESKVSYTGLIRDGELIKSEISSVEKKVSKSVKLVESLNSEKERWISETLTFEEIRNKLVGNSILSSLYSVYASAHEQNVRKQLLSFWKELLSSCNVEYSANFDYCMLNIDSSVRARWSYLGLPDDDFFAENFEGIICTTRNKYPLIIDPEGSVFEVLLAYYGNKSIVTSFLDNSFQKQLENAMRFGGVLCIQDGEFFDPLLMSVLKKEFKNSGGRLSIELDGPGKTIDVAKNFQLIIYTKDKNWNVPEFIKARCHLFDLTITKGNLESQLMQKMLEYQAPELQHERFSLLERNSEFTIKLKELGTKLLTLLNESEGNILDNEDLAQTLEDLNVEAVKTKQELAKINQLVNAQDNVIREFSPLAREAVQVFELLQSIKRKKHWFYDVNVREFLEAVDMVFDKRYNSIEKSHNQIQALFSLLYRVIYYTFGQMFLEKDMLIFGLELFEMHYKREESLLAIEKWSLIKRDIKSLCHQPDLPEVFEDFRNGVMSGDAFDGLHQFIVKFMDNHNPWTLEDTLSINKSTNIIVLGSDKGVDGSFKIQSLSNRSNCNTYTISMGSTESCNMAEEQLMLRIDSGGWLVLQNIQMSIQWCEEKLPRFVDQIKNNSHPNFKLFLTCDLSDAIHPGSQLLQYCKKFSYEGESGVLHNVKKFWKIVLNDNPKKGIFLYLKHLICWIHSLILERVRVTNSNIQYRDVDFELALVSVDDSVTGEFIDWEKLRFLITSIIYCNRMEDGPITEWISLLVDSILSENCFKSNYKIVGDIKAPETKNSADAITKWLNDLSWSLEERDIWLGIPGEQLEVLSLLDAKYCLCNIESIDQ